MTTQTYNLRSNVGQDFKIDFPEPRPGPAVFVIAGHKTGSVLLNNIVTAIARKTNLPAVPVEVILWSQGLALLDWPQEVFDLMEQTGFVYHGFRDLQKLPNLKSFQSGRRIFMIRDPRDVAVSYYYSMSQSHAVPKTGTAREDMMEMRAKAERHEIDSFIINGMMDEVLQNIESFAPHRDVGDTIFYRYEDIIFDKANWVQQVVNDLGVELPQADVQQIAKRFDIIPEQEDVTKHIRQVRPGGYKSKLSMEAIRYIETTFPVFFETYGYAREVG